MKIHKIPLALFVTLVCQLASAQSNKELKDNYILLRKESLEKAATLGIDTIIYGNERTYWLQYLGPNNHPNYYSIDNASAAQTTGTNYLFEGAELGLSLSGENLTVGVWDGGQVQSDHVELSGRTSHKDNSTSSSNHATHVTGTILAKGVNPSARGMANNAKSNNYDFNGDVGEMISEAENGLILSNHSYGLVLGWSFNGGWEWQGDASVSTVEDYRFGFYTAQSRSWDQIVFNNPYYLPVKSAGNDRNDTGSGTGAPADGPFDTIGPQGCAKNVLTIGAVSSITNEDYSRSNISMSSFSSWGPTDDGRIKPDLVGMGVGLFSSGTGSANSYSTLSGTSMSTPNVTGSLLLLQELYQKYNNEFMLAASLKGIAIHTAHDAGNAAGPDYQYGWGLLNVKGAANFLKFIDGKNQIMAEELLSNGSSKEFLVNITSGQKVKATIVWTDVPGTPPSGAVLDPNDLMLVNDLDIVISSPTSVLHQPWIINPETKIVSTGDNYRDNIEVIEFTATESGEYTLIVSHKGTLFNSNAQEYSLFISIDNPETMGNTYRLVKSGENAVWQNKNNETVNPSIFNSKDQLIVDEELTYVLEEDIQAHSLSILGENDVTIDLDGNQLTLHGNLLISNEFSSISNGEIRLDGDFNTLFDVTTESLSSIDLVVNKAGKLVIKENISINSINLLAGDLVILDSELTINEMIVSNEFLGSIDIQNVVLTGLKDFIIPAQIDPLISGSELIFTSEDAKLNAEKMQIDAVRINSGSSLNIISSDSIGEIFNSGILVIQNDLVAHNIILDRSTNLTLIEGVIVEVAGDLISNEENGGMITLASSGSGGTLHSENANKFCFSNFLIDGVSVTGTTQFVLDESSTVNNATGWIIDECSNVLSAAFKVETSCANGISSFIDLSDGTPISWEWTIHIGEDIIILTEQNPDYTFTSAGLYRIDLKVSNGIIDSDYTEVINVIASDIGVPTIIFDGGILRSNVFAPKYQWFLNGVVLEGETEFFLSNISKSGDYAIELYSNKCVTRSSPLFVAIQSVATENVMKIFPSNVSYDLYIEAPSSEQIHGIVLHSIDGKVIPFKINGISDKLMSIDLSNIPLGMYIIQVETKNGTVICSRIIKE